VHEIELSEHAEEMLKERNIPEEWMRRTLNAPERTEIGMDNNTHYIKAIQEHEGRLLRVIVNQQVTPQRIVTLSSTVA
jgi:hypothetical protein